MQQATINLFADMGAQPSTLQAGADPARPLVTSTQSADIFAPTSTITSPAHDGSVESGNRIDDHRHRHRHWRRHGRRRRSVGRRRHDVAARRRARRRGRLSGRRASSVRRPSARGRPTTAAMWNRPDPASRCRSSSASARARACGSRRAVPANPSAADSGEYELGVKFKSDIDGFITGIRFYKGPANNGTHVGNLWTSTGTLLAIGDLHQRDGHRLAAGELRLAGGDHGQHHLRRVVSHAQRRLRVRSPRTSRAPASIRRRCTRRRRAPAAATACSARAAWPSRPTRSTRNNYWVDVVFAPDARGRHAAGDLGDQGDDHRQLARHGHVVDRRGSDIADRLRHRSGDPDRVAHESAAGHADGHEQPASSRSTAWRCRACSRIRPTTTWSHRRDRAGNTTTVAPPTFTVPGPTLRDTASTDFAAGTTDVTPTCRRPPTAK